MSKVKVNFVSNHSIDMQAVRNVRKTKSPSSIATRASFISEIILFTTVVAWFRQINPSFSLPQQLFQWQWCKQQSVV